VSPEHRSARHLLLLLLFVFVSLQSFLTSQKSKRKKPFNPNQKVPQTPSKSYNFPSSSNFITTQHNFFIKNKTFLHTHMDLVNICLFFCFLSIFYYYFKVDNSGVFFLLVLYLTFQLCFYFFD